MFTWLVGHLSKPAHEPVERSLSILYNDRANSTASEQAKNLDETMRRYYEAMGRGDHDEAVELIDAAVEAGLIITIASRYYAVAGDKEKSLDLLEEAVRQRIPQVLVGQAQAGFDPLRSEPRFIAVRRSIGLDP